MQQYRQITAFDTTTYPPLTNLSHLTIFIMLTRGARGHFRGAVSPKMNKFDIFRGKFNSSLPRNNDMMIWLAQIKYLGYNYVIYYNLDQYFYFLGSHFLGKMAENDCFCPKMVSEVQK